MTFARSPIAVKQKEQEFFLLSPLLLSRWERREILTPEVLSER